MHALLNKNTYFVKEHVGMFKAANNYDILDPETGDIMLTCREEKLGFFTKMLRFSEYKRYTPFHIEVKDTLGNMVLEVKRGATFLRSIVEVFDEKGQKVGYFRQRLLTIGGKFDVYDVNDNVLCTLKGKWTGWEFKFLREEVEFAYVTKKWAGLGKELFTTADNYVLNINESVPPDNNLRTLIMAAVMCIDMVLKE